MNKKQTAVEWLFLMLNNPNRDQDFANKLFEKAKEMERQQIIGAFNSGDYIANVKERLDYDESEHSYVNAEQYFTETYGTK